MTEWTAEREVSPAEASALAAAVRPGLAGAPVRLLATGWDNTVYLVGGTWVFRFPRRAVAVPGLERELAVLPRLAPYLPLPVPVPELVGAPTAAFPWPYTGARLLPGIELAEAGPTVRAAAGAGRFLRALHATDLDLPVDPLHRGDPSVRVPRARERLARLSVVYRPDPAVTALLDAAEPLGPPSGPVVVSHGDLHIRHLLLAADGRAAGVIDWGDACRADPAVDLSLAYAGFDGAARDAFLDAYGAVPAGSEPRARVLAVFLCAALAEYAIATGRDRLRATALTGIDRAAR